jgi:glyoxylase-like metal-dependent hydrolase (beta-lactamase superfamily II)
MNLTPLADNVYHLRAGANAGLLVRGDSALLVDAGLDRDAARRIMKHVDALGVGLAAILITHAHADHFGGAADVKRRAGDIPVYAPAFEAAVVENPELEPVYLFAGARPTRELQGKFILAKACPVAGLLQPGRQDLHGFSVEIIPAPGHAHNQVMVGWLEAGVCFAADAFFPPDVLDKYGIPFYVDVDQTLQSLGAVLGLPYAIFAQGHGDAYQAADLPGIVDHNAQRIQAIRQQALDVLDEPKDSAAVLELVANGLGVTIDQPAIYYLARTTIHACLNSLREAGLINIELHDNRLLWVQDS